MQSFAKLIGSPSCASGLLWNDSVLIEPTRIHPVRHRHLAEDGLAARLQPRRKETTNAASQKESTTANARPSRSSHGELICLQPTTATDQRTDSGVVVAVITR